MSILYKPVLIETAEQAEALPVGTLARHSKGAGMDHAHKVEALGFQVWIGDRTNYYNASMVGWTALVPIEAEEETMQLSRTPYLATVRWMTRLVTPWEEA